MSPFKSAAILNAAEYGVNGRVGAKGVQIPRDLAPERYAVLQLRP
jgi:hypothetical protein